MGLVTDINILRQELHKMISNNYTLCSHSIVKRSQELDKLIELYYSQNYNLPKKGASKK